MGYILLSQTTGIEVTAKTKTGRESHTTRLLRNQLSTGEGVKGISNVAPPHTDIMYLLSDRSFCLSPHTRINVSKTTSTAGDTALEISKLMLRAFLKKLLRFLLWDSATVAFVSLFTS